MSGGSGTDAMTILSGGNVGIGTTSPGSPLEVNGNTRLSAVAAGNRYILLGDSSATNTGTGALVIQAGAGSSGYGGAINIFAHSHATKPGWVTVGLSAAAGSGATEARFTVNDQGLAGGTDLFTVLRTGNVGIGTTNPGLKLDVVGNARFSAIGSGTYVGAVNRTADGTLTTATSDSRFKRDIATINNPLDKVMALRGVTFNWIDPDSPKRMMGMIAQEVLPIVPELVFQNSTDGYYGINYGETSGLLIEAIKAQQGEITGQGNQISGLTSNQNKIVEQLTSSASELTGQLTNQALTVDNKLQLIGQSLDNIQTQVVASLQAQLDKQTKDITDLQKQMADIHDVTNIDNFAKKNAPLNTFTGKLEADGVVAGAFTVKAVSGKPKTIGEAYICPKDSADEHCADQDTAVLDGKSVSVDTKNGTLSAVTDTAKIFINFEDNPKAYSWTEKDIASGKFTIKLDAAVTEPVKVNWWIVEDK
ncbi:MAG: tail fiber domain-containing protein [Candidatus Moranbacteria bacterium]|nr:tail fiber domain-containing protein [Candidatus Moranbacteria bacterium]